MADGSFESLGVWDTPGMRSRRVQAYLPRGPAPVSLRPVLFLFDGQNVFGDEGSYSGGWHAHEAVDKLARQKRLIAPVVVAVDHGGEERVDELSAWRVQEKMGGRADLFLDWMTRTLVPSVRDRLSLSADPARTLVGGSSMGGLAALYAHFRHPELFGGAMCMSSSLFAGQLAIFRYLDGRPLPTRSRIYLDAGDREAGGRLSALTLQLASRLERRGYDAQRLKVRIDKRGTHSERHWRRRLPGALRFLLG